MADKPASNVKIYDRPEPKRPSPLLLAVGLLLLCVVGFFTYRAFFAAAPATAPSRTQSSVTPDFSRMGRQTAYHFFVLKERTIEDYRRFV